MSIRIGILGYGNLGRGVECAIKHNQDLELVAVFTFFPMGKSWSKVDNAATTRAA